MLRRTEIEQTTDYARFHAVICLFAHYRIDTEAPLLLVEIRRRSGHQARSGRS